MYKHRRIHTHICINTEEHTHIYVQTQKNTHTYKILKRQKSRRQTILETKGFDRKRNGEERRLGMINRLNYFIFVYENITMKNSALYN